MVFVRYLSRTEFVMRVETAVVNMVEAARREDATPERLAKAFDLALEKVASLSPVGDQALKIVQTNLVKELLKSELNIVARIAKGPRKPRGSGKLVEAGPITKEKTFEAEIEEIFSKPPVARKTRTSKKAQKAATSTD